MFELSIVSHYTYTPRASLAHGEGEMGETAPNFADKTIWTGDNLDILRGMNSECVDLIYLDPPFNSNQNYAAPVGSKAAGAAFKDTWTLSDLDVAWMGLIADERPAMAHVLRTGGYQPREGDAIVSDHDGRAVARDASGSEGYREYLSPLRPYCQPLPEVAYGCDFRGRELSQ